MMFSPLNGFSTFLIGERHFLEGPVS